MPAPSTIRMTARSGARVRWTTPFGTTNPWPGPEVHRAVFQVDEEPALDDVEELVLVVVLVPVVLAPDDAEPDDRVVDPAEGLVVPRVGARPRPGRARPPPPAARSGRPGGSRTGSRACPPCLTPSGSVALTAQGIRDGPDRTTSFSDRAGGVADRGNRGLSSGVMTPDTDTAAPPDPARRSAMLIVFLVVVIDLLGFGIVLPLLPRFAETYLGRQRRRRRGVVIGLLYSLVLADAVRLRAAVGPALRPHRPAAGAAPGPGRVGRLLRASSASPRRCRPSRPTLALALLLRVAGSAPASPARPSARPRRSSPTAPRRSSASGMALIGAAFGIGFTFGPLIGWAGEEVFRGAHVGAGGRGVRGCRWSRCSWGGDLAGDAAARPEAAARAVQPRPHGRGAADADRRARWC